MLVAAVVVDAARGLERGRRRSLDPVALAAGIGVGIASSVVPYVFDQLAMARLARATYSLMVSLLPATATVVGIVVLGQLPTLDRGRGRRARRLRRRAPPRAGGAAS